MDEARHHAEGYDIWPAAKLGLAVLTLSIAAAAVISAARPWAPWVPVALVTVGGSAALLATLLAAVANRLGGDRITTAPEAGTETDPEGAGPSSERVRRFQVDANGGKRVVRAPEIQWVEGAGNYARLYLDGESFLYRSPLGDLADALAPSGFARIHKSAIVNLEAIHRIDPLSSGDAFVHLRSGARVRMSRRYADSFHERTGRSY